MSNICFYNKHMFELYSDLTTMEKLEILADAAKYDVACTSSGVDRKGKKGFLGNSVACGVCHSFGADAFFEIYLSAIVLVLMAGAFRF